MHTVHIPTGFVPDFRAAVLEEIRTDANPDRYDREDAAVIARQVGEDYYVLRQLDTDDQEAVTVEGAAEALAHAFEAMARRLAARLAARIEPTPIDREAAADVYELHEALGWAIDRAAAAHDAYWRGSEAAVG